MLIRLRATFSPIASLIEDVFWLPPRIFAFFASHFHAITPDAAEAATPMISHAVFCCLRRHELSRLSPRYAIITSHYR
jgi:hypothetical protein